MHNTWPLINILFVVVCASFFEKHLHLVPLSLSRSRVLNQSKLVVPIYGQRSVSYFTCQSQQRQQQPPRFLDCLLTYRLCMCQRVLLHLS